MSFQEFPSEPPSFPEGMVPQMPGELSGKTHPLSEPAEEAAEEPGLGPFKGIVYGASALLKAGIFSTFAAGAVAITMLLLNLSVFAIIPAAAMVWVGLVVLIYYRFKKEYEEGSNAEASGV